MRKLLILFTLFFASMLLGDTWANQGVLCDVSPQVMMQNIMKLNKKGAISEIEMMSQLRLYKHSLPAGEWERLVNQFTGGGTQYAPTSTQPDLFINENETVTGSISGRVTDGTNGLPNIQVTVYNIDYKWIGSAYTDATGNYTANNIPSGTAYKVKFSSKTGYGEEWYNNKDHFCSADSVSVTAPNTTGNIDAVLGYPGISTISGSVTNESGTPLEGVEVRLHSENNSWGYLNSTTTDSSGVYQFTGVATGRYKLKFDGSNINYGSEWYNNKVYWNADLVEVANPANVTGINVALAAGGSISGTITDINRNPITITHCYITLWGTYGNIENEFTINPINGDYTISGVPAGQYKLSFRSTDYSTKWYGDKTDFTIDQAWSVTVNPGATTSDIDVVLEKGGGVSGRVTNSNNIGIPDVGMIIWPDGIISGRHGYSVLTDANGDYALFYNPLATGNWVIEFDAIRNNTGYASEWYDSKTSYETADPVHITAPETITVNAQLDQGASGGNISGRVTDGTNGLFGINVSVYDSNHSWVKSASTNCNGEYTVTGLAEGTYKVSFYDNNYGFSSEWYNDKVDFNSADPITVTNSSPTTGIDAVLGSGQHSGQTPLSPIMMMLLNK